ncbi:MAG TPA: four helix bundle protein [Candidatus Woesebacteria bacterium]|nr:four helix bundle protein [Candidatus Woesebacteria bacterium]HRS23023.1 four helix bundle protein [Candidatus Woesebacteria bacterium]HRT40225.1 four helix bundle protein [Candidatus Woesebacteria bacterium]
MAVIKDFYQLDTWKVNYKFVLEIYKCLDSLPKEEKYGIVDQLRRASSSITANIAEGFGRYHKKDKIHFYFQARGSLKEVQNFLLLSKDLGYINRQIARKLWISSKEAEKLINGLIRSTENNMKSS